MKKWIFMMAAAVFLASGCQAGEETANTTNQQVQNHQARKSAAPKAKKFSFNQVKEVSGKKVITNPENVLVLVNKEYNLPGGYAPKDLIRPAVRFSFGDEKIEKSLMRKEAAKALEKMFAAAAKDGVYLYAVSGYRSYNRQVAVFNNEMANSGKEKANQAVATPGQSEHQTGLAMDISGKSVRFLLTESFENTKEGQWLAKHAYEYGYILRYPKGKEEITGYKYEPWHFRYVGVDAAKKIYENGWTLEEFYRNDEKM
ncbi:MAG: M15 family metallopeptidase [Bacillales bacterium]|nr:M15 family metallopeptidase [Bacillales bacterium]